jgi:hypothetical protein
MSRFKKKQEVAGKVGSSESANTSGPQLVGEYPQNSLSQPRYNAAADPTPAPVSYPRNARPAPAPEPRPHPAFLSAQLQPTHSPYSLPNTNVSAGVEGYGDRQDIMGSQQQMPAFLIESPRTRDVGGTMAPPPPPQQQQQIYLPAAPSPARYAGPTFSGGQGNPAELHCPSGSFAPPREVYSAQAPMRTENPNGTLVAFGAPDDGLPKFGRRARTTDGGPRNEVKEARTLQYQQDIRNQAEAAAAKKRADKQREKEEELLFEQKMLEDQRRLAEKERAEQAKERREREENEAAKFGGGKRDKNRSAPQTKAVPADVADGLQAELKRQIEEKKQRKAEEERRKLEDDMKYEEKFRRNNGGGVPPPQPPAVESSADGGPAPPQFQTAGFDGNNAAAQAPPPLFNIGSAAVQQSSAGQAMPPWAVPEHSSNPSPYFMPVGQGNPRYPPTAVSASFDPLSQHSAMFGGGAVTASPVFSGGAPSPYYAGGPGPGAYPPHYGAYQQQVGSVNSEVSALRTEILGMLAQQQLAAAGGGFRSTGGGTSQVQYSGAGNIAPSPNPMLYQQQQQSAFYGGREGLSNPNDVLGQFMRDESMLYGGGVNVFASHGGNVSTNFVPLPTTASGSGGYSSGSGAFDNFLQGYSRNAGPARGGGAPSAVDVSMELGSEPSQFVRLRR